MSLDPRAYFDENPSAEQAAIWAAHRALVAKLVAHPPTVLGLTPPGFDVVEFASWPSRRRTAALDSEYRRSGSSAWLAEAIALRAATRAEHKRRREA